MITNKSVLITYIANGTSTIFTFPFKIFSPEELIVKLNGAEITTGYTINEEEINEGGQVIFTIAPAANTEVVLKRALEIVRPVDFQAGGSFSADDINEELDFQTSCLQQINYELNRSFKFQPELDISNVDLTLPTPKAGSFLVWNNDGNGFELRNADLIIEASNEAHDYAKICQDIFDSIDKIMTTLDTAGLTGKVSNIMTLLQEKFPDSFDSNGDIISTSTSTQNLGSLSTPSTLTTSNGVV